MTRVETGAPLRRPRCGIARWLSRYGTLLALLR